MERLGGHPTNETHLLHVNYLPAALVVTPDGTQLDLAPCLHLDVGPLK